MFLEAYFIKRIYRCGKIGNVVCGTKSHQARFQNNERHSPSWKKGALFILVLSIMQTRYSRQIRIYPLTAATYHLINPELTVAHICLPELRWRVVHLHPVCTWTVWQIPTTGDRGKKIFYAADSRKNGHSTTDMLPFVWNGKSHCKTSCAISESWTSWVNTNMCT